LLSYESPEVIWRNGFTVCAIAVEIVGEFLQATLVGLKGSIS